MIKMKALLKEIEDKTKCSGPEIAEKTGVSTSRYYYYREPDSGRSGERVKNLLRFIVKLWKVSDMSAKEFLEKLAKQVK